MIKMKLLSLLLLTVGITLLIRGFQQNNLFLIGLNIFTIVASLFNLYQLRDN